MPRRRFITVAIQYLMQGARQHSRARLISVLCGAALISISALTIWPGCASIPYKTIRKPFNGRTTQDFDFLKAGKLTRAEMIRKLGEPDGYYPELKVACYRINEVERRRLFLAFFILPMGTERETAGADVAFVQFDEDDRAQRVAVDWARRADRLNGLQLEAATWAASKKK